MELHFFSLFSFIFRLWSAADRKLTSVFYIRSFSHLSWFLFAVLIWVVSIKNSEMFEMFPLLISFRAILSASCCVPVRSRLEIRCCPAGGPPSSTLPSPPTSQKKRATWTKICTKTTCLFTQSHRSRWRNHTRLPQTHNSRADSCNKE